jgi:hypothetical protein
MGGGASTPFDQVDAAMLEEHVRQLGPLFAEYADAIRDNGVDGATVREYFAQGEEGVTALLADLEVADRLRRKQLTGMRKNVVAMGGGPASRGGEDGDDGDDGDDDEAADEPPSPCREPTVTASGRAIGVTAAVVAAKAAESAGAAQEAAARPTDLLFGDGEPVKEPWVGGQDTGRATVRFIARGNFGASQALRIRRPPSYARFNNFGGGGEIISPCPRAVVCITTFVLLPPSVPCLPHPH